MSSIRQNIHLMLEGSGWQRLVLVVAVCVVVAVIYIVLIRAVRSLVRKMPIASVAQDTLVRVVRWVLFPVAILVVLQQLGADIGQFWTFISAILALVAIGFVAVWSVLSNLLCSILIFLFKPFEEGERIEIREPTGDGRGLEGRVQDIGWMYTVLRQRGADGGERLTTVPNNIFFQKCVSREAPAQPSSD